MTYALKIHIDSYELRGELHLVGDDYETPAGVLEHVAADYILAMCHHGELDAGLCQFLIDTFGADNHTTESVFEETDAETRFSLYADPYYAMFSFTFDEYADEREFHLGKNPTHAQIQEAAAHIEEDLTE